MKHMKLFITLLLILIISNNFYAQDVNNGLTGYWSFDDEANVGQDLSQFGNDGVNLGGANTTGIVGNALEFDGASVFRVHNTVADNPELNFVEQGAISFWYKTTIGADNWMSVIRHEHHFTPLQMTQFDGGGN